MTSRCLASVLLVLLGHVLHATENDDWCVALEPETDAYVTAYQAMSGHFPVEIQEIQGCGRDTLPKQYKALVDTYQTSNDWYRFGRLDCWRFTDHQPGAPYSCGTEFVSTHMPTNIEVVSKHEIPLQAIHEVVMAVVPRLLEGEEIQSINYVPVHCGGAWSIATHGFGVGVKSSSSKQGRGFSAKKNCSPTPCVWEVEALEPRWRTH